MTQFNDVLPYINLIAIFGLIYTTVIVLVHKVRIEANQAELNRRLDKILWLLTKLPTRDQAAEIAKKLRKSENQKENK